MVKTYSYQKDGATQLTPHFKVREFFCHDNGGKILSDTILIDDALTDLLEQLYAALEEQGYNVVGIYINSGYRTPEFDKSIGGNGRGQHTLGKAADINVRVSGSGEHVEQRGDKYYLTADKLCCTLQDLDAHGIGYMGGIAVHADVREGHWWGDERTGNDNIRDWYAYFGIQPPQPEPAPEPEETVYTVVRGDTLSGIAARYGTTYQALAEYNGIANPSLIHVGQEIRIPGAAGPGKPQEPVTYTVVKGDSLSRIGNRLGVPWRKIAEANNIEAPYTIFPGQVLVIPEV